MNDAPATIVRVLSGRPAGASKSLPPSGRITVGYDFWHDVVLRDPTAKGCAVELTRTPEGGFYVKVLDGETRLLGAAMRAGEASQLPPYVPVSLGGVAIAVGQEQSDRWAETDGLVANASAEPPPAPTAAEAVLDDMRERWRSGPARLGRWRRAILVGAGVLVATLVGAGAALQGFQYGFGTEERARNVLQQGGYHRLRIEKQGSRVVVSGLVATEADQDRVEELLQQAGADVVLQVQSRSELSRAAADVARLNGIQAEARTLNDGTVVLTAPPLDATARAQLEQVLRRDVSGLSRIQFEVPPEPPIRSLAEAVKREASVVTGDPAYIVTADGARYFPGAILPSGHELVAIGEDRVVLSRRGKQQTFTF